MRRLTGSALVLAALLGGASLATGCASGGGPISSFSPSRTALPSTSATASPDQSATATAAPTVTQTATPTVTPTATAAPTVTQTATAPAVAPAVTPSSTSAPTGASSAVIWPWILLGVIVLIGLIVLISRASRRRSRAGGDWQARVIDAYAKGSALHDAMSVAEAPGALYAADAGARWSDIQRRADDLTQTLYALREAAPDDRSRALISDLLTSLQVVRSAMDAERAAGTGAGEQQAQVARSRLSSFEASLRALRNPDERVG